MDVYIYRAALLCTDCCDDHKQAIHNDPNQRHKIPADPDNERSFDSDDFPKGPFRDGGGEADHPQHCDTCGLFLENPLTEDGSAYVKRRFKDDDLPAAFRDLYARAYPNEYDEAMAELEMTPSV